MFLPKNKGRVGAYPRTEDWALPGGGGKDGGFTPALVSANERQGKFESFILRAEG